MRTERPFLGRERDTPSRILGPTPSRRAQAFLERSLSLEIAIVGNAAEHSTAVLVAMKNHMDLALNIAVGSAIQIALSVAPVLVLASYFIGPGPMDLRFTPFEVLAVLAAVGVTNVVAQDGESNWLEGALLLAVYVVLGMAFYFLPA